MKNLFKSILTISVLAAVALCTTACGNSQPAPSSSTDTTAASSKAEETTSNSSSAISLSGKYTSVEEYVKSEEIQNSLDSLRSSFSSYFDINITAEGNKFIYEYKYIDQIDDSVLDATKEQLESNLEGQASTFENVASSLKLAVDVKNPVVVLRYYNADGSLILEKEFTAD